MADETEPKEGGGMKWILIALLVVVTATAGFLGYMVISGGSGGSSQPSGQAPAPAPVPAGNPMAQGPGITMELDSFIVNLRDRDGKRYLKAKITVEVSSEALKEEISTRKPQIRDVILLLLSAKSFAEISRLEGKMQLKEEVIMRINQVLSSGRISQVYFTEFVVQ